MKHSLLKEIFCSTTKPNGLIAKKGNQQFHMDGLLLSVEGLFSNRVNFWFGRIPTPVGTFSPRSYSHINPLIGFPPAYHFKVPYNVFTLSSETRNLFLRDNNFGGGTAIYEACWITGATVFGMWNDVEYMIAAGRGTLTNPEAGRIGYKFNEEVHAGFSAGIAPHLEHETNLPSGVGIRDPKHVIAGVDIGVNKEYSSIYMVY